MERWERILRDYDVCECANPKLKTSKRCRECYSKGKGKTVSRMMAWDRRKSNLGDKLPVA